MNKDEIEDNLQKAVGQVESGIADIVGGAHSTVSRDARDDAQTRFEHVRERATEAAAREAQYVQDVYAHPRRYLERGTRVVTAQFNHNPLLTVAIASISGLFLGFLIGRESR